MGNKIKWGKWKDSKETSGYFVRMGRSGRAPNARIHMQYKKGRKGKIQSG